MTDLWDVEQLDELTARAAAHDDVDVEAVMLRLADYGPRRRRAPVSLIRRRRAPLRVHQMPIPLPPRSWRVGFWLGVELAKLRHRWSVHRNGTCSQKGP